MGYCLRDSKDCAVLMRISCYSPIDIQLLSAFLHKRVKNTLH